VVVSAEPAGFSTLEIGSPAPDFSLPGVDDRNYRLGDFRDAEVLIVIFTCNHCPTAQAYEDRIKKLYDDYHDRGVALVAISPNDPLAVRLDELGYTDLGDSFADMKIRAEERGFKFPYLYDGETQATSLAFGVLATPHVFIFDKDRKLRYKGRIDDSEVKTVTSHDARNALDALLAGKPVSVESTRVFGCSTKWSDKRDSAKEALEKWNQEPVELGLISEVELKQLAANRTDNYRLVNVWATWCAPCIEELPEFVTINRMYRGRNFEMITISADDPAARDKAIEVLKDKYVACKNYLFDSDDRDQLFDGLDPEWQGAVPYTALIAPGGEVVFRNHGEIDPHELKRVIADRLGRTYAPR
jgi:peroxiredoxin